MGPAKLLLSLLVIICLSGAAKAELSLQMNFYNPEDSISVDLMGENMKFDAGINLMPDSVFYNNGGTSLSDNGFYSYQAVLNGEKITSGAKTDSGSFSWHTSAYSGVKGIDPSKLAVGTNSTVNNGTLYTYSSNPDYRINQTMQAFNAIGFQQGTVMPHSMSYSGIGQTIESSLLHQVKGFADTMNIENLIGEKKPASLNLNANGDTDSKWQYYLKSDRENYAFAQAVIGVMRPSDNNNLTMKGEAAGFPDQVLPYHGINISYQLSDANYNKSFDRLNAEINESINQSHGIYSVPSGIKPVPVYSFDQKNLTDPVNIDIAGNSSKKEVFYRMSMQFKVDV